MKLLLTSGGVSNPSIRSALLDLLDKPIEEASALAIPTAQWGHPMCGPSTVRRFLADQSPAHMCDLGWQSVGVLELTALPSISPDRWIPWVREADVLLADGGAATFLSHWMRESGLTGLLPELTDTVWVGISAGSMVMTPRIGREFVEWPTPDSDDTTLGLVDFSIFPHLNHPDMPHNTMAAAEKWATKLSGPSYALDDSSAIAVNDGTLTVVSEGQWRHLSD